MSNQCFNNKPCENLGDFQQGFLVLTPLRAGLFVFAAHTSHLLICEVSPDECNIQLYSYIVNDFSSIVDKKSIGYTLTLASLTARAESAYNKKRRAEVSVPPARLDYQPNIIGR